LNVKHSTLISNLMQCDIAGSQKQKIQELQLYSNQNSIKKLSQKE